MNTTILAIIFVVYTALLFVINIFTSKKSSNDNYYRGGRNSPWFVVAYGMIGASLSGVTFMSVPGNVFRENFYYLPMVLGFIVGYIIIATVLLPLYYRLNLTSIYSYLDKRFGNRAYISGSAYFILSRSLGAALRMFLVIGVLYEFIFKDLGLSFPLITAIFILIILLYTIKGGIKTIVWTDTLQTTFMLLSVFISIFALCGSMSWSFFEGIKEVASSSYSEIWQTDPLHKRFFIKQFLSGLFVTVTMTGLDQDMMQKNLSCKNLAASQKNMFTFSSILLVINLLFLFLGALLCIYAKTNGLEVKDTDNLFPNIAFNYMPIMVSLTFIIGVLSAAYSSADGAMTALTTSFTLDILKSNKVKTRKIVHLSCAFLFFLLIILFYSLKSDSVINMVYDIASYTYGPLLGLFFVGICTKWEIKDKFIPFVVVLSPLISFGIVKFSAFLGYNFGFEVLLLNGLLCTLGLVLIKK